MWCLLMQILPSNLNKLLKYEQYYIIIVVFSLAIITNNTVFTICPQFYNLSIKNIHLHSNHIFAGGNFHLTST